jgi:predicted signal transduction protein with EAL and GGDEF domain
VRSSLRPNSLPQLAVFLSIFFWIFDSIVDVLVFEEGESIREALFSPEPMELWMRVLVISLFMLSSFYAKYLLNVQTNLSNELLKHKKELEQTVTLRTQELESKNQVLQNEVSIRKKAEEALKELASKDPLTTLYNRRKFSELLKHEIERELRYKDGLALIMCDLDKFKHINDTYGHNSGDEVLKRFSHVAKNVVRAADIVARWGGGGRVCCAGF